jgi:hypothetical protein
MMAGPAYNAKITSDGGRLKKLLKENASNEEILDEFYVAALMRPPTIEEKSELLRFLAQRSSRRERPGRARLGNPQFT